MLFLWVFLITQVTTDLFKLTGEYLMSKAYIENLTASELKEKILSDDEFKFKHQDCAAFFTSDGDHLYANDVGDNGVGRDDIFIDGNFAEAIFGHYGEKESVVELLESLEEVDMPLELSDAFNNHSMSISDFKDAINEL